MHNVDRTWTARSACRQWAGHLSAVRVSGESQADSFRHFGKQVGVMHEHKYRPGVIDLRHGLQQAVPARPQIRESCQPEGFPGVMKRPPSTPRMTTSPRMTIKSGFSALVTATTCWSLGRSRYGEPT